jgi:catechol 2,3-dioxygenase-like lactoylglutathione lyase family enzyme
MEVRMIGVKKIAHATYEVPDVDKQVEYYTEILGLTVTGKDKDAVYLASTVDHHSIVVRKGAQAQCVRVGFQIGARRRSQCIRGADAGAGHQDPAQKGPRAHDLGPAHIRRLQGHGDGGVQARRLRRTAFFRTRASFPSSSATSLSTSPTSST